MAKGVPHYLKDGTEYKGAMHKMPDGSLHTGSKHTESSERLYHRDDLVKKLKSAQRKRVKK